MLEVSWFKPQLLPRRKAGRVAGPEQSEPEDTRGTDLARKAGWGEAACSAM